MTTIEIFQPTNHPPDDSGWLMYDNTEPRHIVSTPQGPMVVWVHLDEWGFKGSVKLDRRYHVAKREIANELAALCTMRIRTTLKNKVKGNLPPALTKLKATPGKQLKRACTILRELRDVHGIQLDLKMHPLQRWAMCPIEPPPAEFTALWDKDHVFRGVALRKIRHLGQGTTWDNLLNNTLEGQRTLQADLIKPFRRMLAERRISVAVASTIAANSYTRQQTILNGPKWSYRSAMMINQRGWLRAVERIIKMFHRTPASDITNPKLKHLAGQDVSEWSMAVQSIGMSGGTVPTSMRGVRQLHKDLHDKRSAAYKLVNREREISVWALNAPLPPLPSLGSITLKLFQKHEDYIHEAKEMKHCIAMYAGQRALFAHIEREEDKVTLYISPEGGFQCYGPYNAITELSRDVVDKWVPSLKEWLTKDKLTEVAPPVTTALQAPEYE